MKKVPLLLLAGTLGTLALGGALYVHARGEVNNIALAALPKGATVVRARTTTYQPDRRYVGTIAPWIAANIGPQFVSAYVDSVLVRPGALVRRGQVLATLDCRNTSAAAKAVTQQARAVEKMQAAVAEEAQRMTSLLKGGFASPDEVEQKQADAASKEAQLLALRAQELGTDLQVKDCVLRAPFDGEVAERAKDPGAFVRPGQTIVSVVDRALVRVNVDVPEDDFELVAPGTPVELNMLSTGANLTARISRRAPAADEATRSIHVEIDLKNGDRSIPAGTTAEVHLNVGKAVPALEVPLVAANVRGSKAVLFTVENDVAHQRDAKVLGEREGLLYLEPTLPESALVVTEGRSALADGDRVAVKVDGAQAAAR